MLTHTPRHGVRPNAALLGCPAGSCGNSQSTVGADRCQPQYFKHIWSNTTHASRPKQAKAARVPRSQTSRTSHLFGSSIDFLKFMIFSQGNRRLLIYAMLDEYRFSAGLSDIFLFLFSIFLAFCGVS